MHSRLKLAAQRRVLRIHSLKVFGPPSLQCSTPLSNYSPLPRIPVAWPSKKIKQSPEVASQPTAEPEPASQPELSSDVPADSIAPNNFKIISTSAEHIVATDLNTQREVLLVPGEQENPAVYSKVKRLQTVHCPRAAITFQSQLNKTYMNLIQ